jgi:hypothetical protein
MNNIQEENPYHSFDDFFIVSIPEECTICLESQKEKELTVLRCKHTFHQKCTLKWFQNKRTCPICRKYIPINEENNNQETEDNPINICGWILMGSTIVGTILAFYIFSDSFMSS